MVDVETILASLYAKEISASLEWKSDRGFYPGFGYPAIGKKRFRTSGEAVRWLKEQALVKYPSIKFPPERNRIDIDAEAILNDLSASQIGGSIEWIWDGGFFASLGGQKRAEEWSLKTVGDAVEWLKETACRVYPESEFARKYAGFV
jgi:disulfide oxidoreductase YuzD